MSANLNSLYSSIVFEHDRRPQNAGLREPYESEVHHVNPTCGDELTMRLHLSGEGPQAIIEDISYDAVGCSMSRASASIMSDLLIGQTLEQAQKIYDSFATAMASRGQDPGDEDMIGDGIALVGASKFPGRVKCVLLAWKAFEALQVEAQAVLARSERDQNQVS
ncbi:Fe-S cluster assembly sulfur transfer protein SufU [Devriesea agamarum]|uniref:Fe-S cluster assembly sulfur transfer protein SufU n=1 Tax=Devriesea agamarum TaxID=472569 RepID=UPI00071D2340|nr:SUF system NifU family Fe-S cluster assembly protein [Devriesea agamarum]